MAATLVNINLLEVFVPGEILIGFVHFSIPNEK